MGAFLQMGHNSENLLYEEELSRFNGAILSPLNYGPGAIADQIGRLKDRAGFVTILDPYLYRPKSDRLCLPEWDYYPKDVESSDSFGEEWWNSVVDRVAEVAMRLGVTAVASPAIVPRAFPDEFFMDLVRNGNRLELALRGTPVRPLQTVVVNMPELSVPAQVMKVASLISRSRVSDCLLVFVNDVEPRLEFRDPEELKGAMLLIATLRAGGQAVTVPFSSSDMILWKAAGATDCASGKFFNLRRFTISRFEEPGGGGGQLAYWFEESLLAFLRQSDTLRVEERRLASAASDGNPFCPRILERIQSNQPWVGLGWRQFLYWFADTESRVGEGPTSAEELISAADGNWGVMEKSKPPLFMEERQNDGSWVRQWRRALAEFPYFA